MNRRPFLKRQRWQAQAERWRQGWAIFRHQPIGLLGLALICLFAFMAAAYPILRLTVWRAPIYSPTVGFDRLTMPHPSPPSWLPPERLAPNDPHRFDPDRPSYGHLLGTDTVGRDVLSVLLASTGPTFLTGLTAALVTAGLGLLLAAGSAYYGRWVDRLISHVSDAFLLLPAPIFMIAVGSFFRNTTIVEAFYTYISDNTFSDGLRTVWGPVEFGALYGLVAGAGGATVILRGQALKVMTLPYIEAARVAGAGGRHIIFQHIIPQLTPLAALYMMITVTWVVVADGFLAFLGFTLTRLNWGAMIYNAFAYQAINSAITWNVLTPAAICISLFAGAFYMVSRGLHAVIEPRLRIR